MTNTLYIIFFLSGSAALIFETVWFRLAGLLLGNSIWSASLILSGFMGGLALGNGLVSRYGGYLKRPVRTYAKLEFGIGTTGLLLVMVMPKLHNWLVPILKPFLDQPDKLNMLRLVISFLLIIVPTTAMGATLPVVVKALYRFDLNFGAVLGRLYGLNTLGAVTGALAGELMLIKVLGINGTGLIAASMNMLAALLSLKVSSVVDPAVSRIRVENENLFLKNFMSLKATRLLLVAFLAGFNMLALEVVWFRFLILFYRGTSLTFAVMLSIVLAGIGIGGVIGAMIFKRRIALHNHTRTIVIVSGFCAVATYLFFGKVFYAVFPSNGYVTVTSFILFSFFLMFPVSFFSGVLFTSIGHSIKEEAPSETLAAGLLTLSNTIGALAGSFAGAFLLLPVLGMETSLFAVGAIYGLMALIIPWSSIEFNWKARSLSFAILAMYLLIMVLFPFGHMEENYFDIVDRRLKKNEERIAVRETLTETIFYYRYDVMEQPFYYRLVTNGYSMSGTLVEAKRYMKLFVYLPLALKPDSRNALLISYGVGSTAKALSDSAQFEAIDIVDISKDILEMSSIIYPEVNDNPLNDDRVSVYIEDGRFFLQSREKSYDLITGEPPPPKVAGIVNLYSQEYFSLIHQRLTEGGVVSYWLPVHSLLEEDAKSIIKAFCNIFDDCTLWAGAGKDWLLLGTKNLSPPGSTQLFVKQWDDPRTVSELRKLGIENPSQLGSLFMADSPYLKELVSSTYPLTDNYPLRLSTEIYPDEKKSPMYAAMMKEDEAMLRFQRSAFIQKTWPEEIKKDTLKYFYFQRIIKGILVPDYRETNYYEFDDLFRVLTKSSLKTLPLWMMGTSWREVEIAHEQSDNPAYQKNVKSLLFIEALAKRDYTEGVSIMESIIRERSPAEALSYYPMYLFALCMSGKIDEADYVAEKVAPLLKNKEDMKIFWKWMNSTFGLKVPKP